MSYPIDDGLEWDAVQTKRAKAIAPIPGVLRVAQAQNEWPFHVMVMTLAGLFTCLLIVIVTVPPPSMWHRQRQLERIEEEGEFARKRGFKIEHNPFARETTEYARWQRGFIGHE